MLEIQKLLKENPDWRIELEKLNILVVEDENYYKFKYDFIGADYTKEIVRECRGITLCKKTLDVVCYPFYKFGNFGEKRFDGENVIDWTPEIDWNSVKCLEKIDGSMISLWYHNGEWRLSTSGMIDAFDAPVGNDIEYITFQKNNQEEIEKLIQNVKEKDFEVSNEDIEISEYCRNNFGNVFLKAAELSGLDFYKLDHLDKNYTYVFELVSPETKVIVPYNEYKISHLMSRNMTTLKEEDLDIGIQKPREDKFNSFDELLEHVSKLDWKDEGYVLVDKYYNRVKVKSPEYVRVAGISMGITSNNFEYRCFPLALKEGLSELVTYFPKYKEPAEKLEVKTLKVIEDILFACEKAKEEVSKIEFDPRIDNFRLFKSTIAKAFRDNNVDNKYNGILFSLLNEKTIINENIFSIDIVDRKYVVECLLKIDNNNLIKRIL